MNLLKRACRASSTNDLTIAKNQTKEALQEVILYQLDQNGFFEEAVFHGGTCLRIVFGLDRFSEDLDFNLLVPKRNFTMRPILDNMMNEFADMGLDTYYRERMARGVKPIYSTKISANLRQSLRLAGFDEKIVQTAHSKENIVVKLDADTEPPATPRNIIVHKEEPLEYDVRTEPLPTLFAGKTAAVLCREWKNRIKGRDFYDFRWYVEHRVPLDFDYLRTNLDEKCNRS